jgi:hypothetical protein
MSNNNAQIRKSTYTSTTAMIIIGVLILAFIVMYLYNTYISYKNNIATTATKASAACPDYWDSIGNNKCQNSNSLGTCSNTPGANIMDFSGEIFNNANTGNYSKCKWANGCNVSWSGIERLC